LNRWIEAREWRCVMSAEQKVAIVTGSSQGIGAGLVEGVPRSELSRCCQLPVDQAFDVTVPADISELETVRQIVEQGRFGRID
jgi:NAD(P)-dependent dehydrogenase (short-subunit alcohol dehydrogenase family)